MSRQQVVINFRTHRYIFTRMDQVPPDWVMEHLMHERIFQLRTNTPPEKARLITPRVKDAIIGERHAI